MNDPIIDFFLENKLMEQIIVFLACINISVIISIKFSNIIKTITFKRLLKGYGILTLIVVFITPFEKEVEVILKFLVALGFLFSPVYTIYKWNKKLTFDKKRNIIYIISSFIFFICSTDLVPLYKNLTQNFTPFYKEILLELFLTIKIFFFIFFGIVNFVVFLYNIILLLKEPLEYLFNLFSSILKMISFAKIAKSLETLSCDIKNRIKEINISAISSRVFKSSVILTLIGVYSIVLNCDKIFNSNSTDFFSIVVITVLVPLIYGSIKDNKDKKKN